MKYVNFGSNWGGKKDGVNILDIFTTYGIVFAGLDSDEKGIDNINKYKEGDVVVVTDGVTIVAIGIAKSSSNILSSFRVSEDIEEEMKKRWKPFHLGDYIIAIEVELYELIKDEQIKHGSMGVRFKGIQKKETIIYLNDLLEKYEGVKMLEDTIELLKQNKNLILTGAPGTGKTYLAKQIAYELCIGNKNSSEEEKALLEKDFEYQCGFVQFHPSYDYTDFVEGLRPVNNGESNIGFERRDGVFKDFCKRALKNYLDSRKPIEELNYENIVEEYLEIFIEEVSIDIDNDSKYSINGIGSGTVTKSITATNLENKTLSISFRNIDIDKQNRSVKKHINIWVDWYIRLFKENLATYNYKTISNIIGVGYTTYKYGFLRAFYEKYHSKIEEKSKNIGIEGVKEKNFVFIIDEINRGEISKIFGELFFSIDPGYRGKNGRVKTQYHNLISDDEVPNHIGDKEIENDYNFSNGFYIPENVYIIGTMNDIDRSVESMDFAMRRRFAWVEVDTKDTQYMIEKYFINSNNKIKEKLSKKTTEDANRTLESIIEQSIERMDSLNNKIAATEDLSKHYQIGASYFLKLENYYDENKDIEEAFESLWEYHLKGLLTEYLRGNPKEAEILSDLKKAYNMLTQDKKDNKGEKQEENSNTTEKINTDTQS